MLSDNDIGVIAVIAIVIGILAGIAVYLIPTIVAAKKKSPKKTTVILLNIFLGWLLPVWVVCFVLACKKPVSVTAAEEVTQSEVMK